MGLGIGFWAYLVIAIAATGLVRFVPISIERYRVPAAAVVFLGFMILLPFEMESFRTGQMTEAAIWVIVVMGLNILTGYNGQISLGHGALVALGAYTSALLMDSESQIGFVDGEPWPFWTTIIAAAVIVTVVGFLLAIPALRLSGPYLAIATLALVISFPSIIRRYDGLTGGSQGIAVRPPPPPPFLDFLERDEWLYFLTLFSAVIMLLIAWSIVRGPLGRSFIAVRDSETAAAAMGINVARTKIAAFTISAFYAGVAGGLYAQVFRVVTPESITIVESINFLTAIVIGGLGSILGSIIGASVIVYQADIAEGFGDIPLLPSALTTPGAIQGMLVILVILIMPYGVAGFLTRLSRMRPSAVGDWARGLPAAARARWRAAREDLSWAWESRPWNRQLREQPAPEPKEHA